MPNLLTPPGNTVQIAAEKVLILAPHQDDELLGCGGLLKSLVERGSAVSVLFLTDGGGGVERTPAGPGGENGVGEGIAAVRRRESEAVAEFAGWSVQQLSFRDGSLAANIVSLAAGIEEHLLAVQPDLVLVPSPLELTPDHVAAFESLFAVLTRLRSGDALFESAAGCRYLTYSVNHPGYPNVLVDVSAHMEWLRDAMAIYESQLALHNYTHAGVGLRRFRTHSLGPEVEGAEGYARLALTDFTTNTLATLVEMLGAPAQRAEQATAAVSLIVRTFNRPELLAEALESVARSHWLPAELVLVNDGGVDPLQHARVKAALEGLPFTLKPVQLERNSGRAAAANAGLAAATCEFVSFLDDDDLVFPEHLQVLASAVSAPGVRAIYSDAAVARYELRASLEVDGRDGGGWSCIQRSLPYSRDFDPVRILIDNYIPFHTLLVERDLALSVGFDEDLEAFEDWDFIIRLCQQSTLHHVRQVTCEYRHFVGSAHHAMSTQADASQQFLRSKAKVIAKHRGLLGPERLTQAVTELRRETVDREQEAAELRARWETDRLARAEATHAATELRQALAELESQLRLAEERYHWEHGEVESLRLEDQRLRERIHVLSQDVDIKQRQLETRQQQLETKEQQLATKRQQLETKQQQLKSREQQLATQAQQLEVMGEQERQLRSGLEENSEHLGRTYGEIERLMALIAQMQGTRAWWLHKLLHRSSKN